MSEIQRYDLETTGDGEYAYCESMRKRADGDWVTYDDHVAAVAAERQRIIDEMVTPLMEAVRLALLAGRCNSLCRKPRTACIECEIGTAGTKVQDIVAAVSAKLKETKG